MTTTDPTIAEQVVDLQNMLSTKAPAGVLGAFGAEQAALDAAGIPVGVAVAGSALPDGDVLDAHGTRTTLAAVRAGRPAVVVFYRGAWCPYCNIALRTYQQQLLPALVERGIALIAVNPQRPDDSLTMAETNALTFDVVSDEGNRIAARLGILTAPTADALQAQQTLGLDLTKANADGTTTIPMPTTLVVDADGLIRWIDVHPNYTTRSESAEILAAVATI